MLALAEPDLSAVPAPEITAPVLKGLSAGSAGSAGSTGDDGGATGGTTIEGARYKNVIAVWIGEFQGLVVGRSPEVDHRKPA